MSIDILLSFEKSDAPLCRLVDLAKAIPLGLTGFFAPPSWAVLVQYLLDDCRFGQYCLRVACCFVAVKPDRVRGARHVDRCGINLERAKLLNGPLEVFIHAESVALAPLCCRSFNR